MHIGIIFAMPIERDAFLKYVGEGTTKTHKRLVIHETTHAGHTLTLALSGVGKVNAAYAIKHLIDHYPVEVILNSGVAGGLNVPHETLVLSRAVTHHDVDVTSFGTYIKGQVPGLEACFKADASLIDMAESILEKQHIDYRTGLIASGDQFMLSQAPLEAILKIYDNVYAVEMEAAAIAQVAYLERLPFLIIRTISDVIGEPSQSENFNAFVARASKRAAQFLKDLIEAL